MMTAEELRTIARSEQFEIGSHTLTHPLLAALAEADQREEIAGSRAVLQRLIDGSILSFAYPYGGVETINNVTTRLVREAGYERACIVGEFPSSSQLTELRLPRRVVGDWDRETFAQHVNLWLES
jgi:peptidoglycan/xylan/chitin deacetylase (PgdA/CDA1 family)